MVERTDAEDEALLRPVTTLGELCIVIILREGWEAMQAKACCV